MANFVILDTSVYRQLGLKFYDNLDYRNLFAFTANTIGEVMLSSIVLEEFLDYYRSEITRKKDAYLAARNALHRDPYFQFDDPALEKLMESEVEIAIGKFKKAVSTDPGHSLGILTVKSNKMDALDLTKFILMSKADNGKNVQIRDYLIWHSILEFARSLNRPSLNQQNSKKEEKDIVSFITKDKGYENDELFLKLKDKYDVSNIELFESIPDFLTRWGFYFRYITESTILQKIKKSRILKDLNKDIGALITYVSKRYNHSNYKMYKVEQAEVESMAVDEYYTYIDPTDRKYMYVAHIKVEVNVVFEPDELGWKESLSMVKGEYNNLQTFDDLMRPYFRKPLIFFYGGLIDEEHKSIKSVKFIDFELTFSHEYFAQNTPV